MAARSKASRPGRTRAAAVPATPRVAYLGPEGTYTHSAVQLWFRDGAEELPRASIEDVFQAVQDGTADFGVAPVENSSEGAVNSTLDRLMSASPPMVKTVTIVRL